MPDLTLDNDPIFEHARLELPADFSFAIEDLLPIVVGAHVRAEIADRPLADDLARVVREIRRARGVPEGVGRVPVVCTDLWFLNDADLMRQPAIVVGDPGVNAATAHFARKLPQVFVVDQALQVLLDAEGLDLQCAMWGVDAASTEEAGRGSTATHSPQRG